MNRLAMIEALKLSEDRIRAVRQDLEESERTEEARKVLEMMVREAKALEMKKK